MSKGGANPLSPDGGGPGMPGSFVTMNPLASMGEAPQFPKRSDDANGSSAVLLSPEAKANRRLSRSSVSCYPERRKTIMNLRRAEGMEEFISSEEYEKMTKFESLDYGGEESQYQRDQYRSLTSKDAMNTNMKRWIVTGLIGLVTGLVAYFAHYAIENIEEQKFDKVQDLLEKDGKGVSFVTYWLINTALAVGGSFIVLYVEPAAAGSGIPEVKGYLNGIKLKSAFSLKTMIGKVIGVICSVSSSLPVGPEGPMIHFGAMVGAGVSQGRSKTLIRTGVQRGDPLEWLTGEFRNDRDRRDFISSGAACGVSAAFGAPTGGILFSLEEASSFWSNTLTWRTYFGCMISTFTMNFFLSEAYNNNGEFDKASTIIFGAGGSPSDTYRVYEVPAFLFLGALGGLLGAFFTWVNVKLGTWRRDHINHSKILRLIEVLLIITVVSIVSFFLPSAFGCMDESVLNRSIPICSRASAEGTFETVPYTCPTGFYNQMATLTFTRQEASIRHLFSRNTSGEFTPGALICFFLYYYILSCWTAGSSISSGLVVPMLATGAAYGRMFGHIMHVDWGWHSIDPGVYALIGAAGYMGGVMRMTVSLTVILLEITNELVFLLPIMMTIMMAKFIADRFIHPLYDIQLEMKFIPFLEPELGIEAWKMEARDIMRSPVRTVPTRIEVGAVLDLLTSCGHNGFPVVRKDSGAMQGFILRKQLLFLITERVLTDASGNPVANEMTPEMWHRLKGERAPEMSQVNVSEQDRRLFVDIAEFMNRSYTIIHADTTVSWAYHLFRSLGLRHLTVVDDDGRVTGMITRKDMLEKRIEEVYHLLHGAHH